MLSALVPLVLCAMTLFRAFGAELSAIQERSLDGMVRSFGMTVLGRLGSADDVLGIMVAAPGATDDSVQRGVATLPWRSREAEAALTGKPVDEKTAWAAAEAAFAGAVTHGMNDFKPELGRRTLVRALLQAARMEV